MAMSESHHLEAGEVASIKSWECQDMFPGQLTSNLPNTLRSPFRQHPGLDDAQTNQQVDTHMFRELERGFNLDRPDSQDDLCNDHWSWTSLSHSERTASAAPSQHPNTTSFGGNLPQKLLREEATSQNSLPLFLTGIHPADVRVAAGCFDRTHLPSDTICHGHGPSFANAVNPLDNSLYSEIHHVQGDETLVDPTNEGHTPLASRHSLLSDPPLEQGGHGVRYGVHGTTSGVIAPGNQHTDGCTMAAFMPGSSIQPGQDLGRSCDHNNDPCPDATSSQTVQHTHVHSPNFYEEPAVTRTSQKTKNRGVEVGHKPTEYKCTTCDSYFYAEKGLTRHIKDIHLKRNGCPFCSTFKWSQGRRYLFKKHLKLRHQADLQAVLKDLCNLNDVVPGCATPP